MFSFHLILAMVICALVINAHFWNIPGAHECMTLSVTHPDIGLESWDLFVDISVRCTHALS